MSSAVLREDYNNKKRVKTPPSFDLIHYDKTVPSVYRNNLMINVVCTFSITGSASVDTALLGIF